METKPPGLKWTLNADNAGHVWTAQSPRMPWATWKVRRIRTPLGLPEPENRWTCLGSDAELVASDFEAYFVDANAARDACEKIEAALGPPKTAPAKAKKAKKAKKVRG